MSAYGRYIKPERMHIYRKPGDLLELGRSISFTIHMRVSSRPKEQWYNKLFQIKYFHINPYVLISPTPADE